MSDGVRKLFKQITIALQLAKKGRGHIKACKKKKVLGLQKKQLDRLKAR